MKQAKFVRKWFPNGASRPTLCGVRELRGWTMFISVCQILLHVAAVLFFLAFFIWPSRMHSFFHLQEPKFHHEKPFEEADLDPEDSIHKLPPHFFHGHGHFPMHHHQHHMKQSQFMEKKTVLPSPGQKLGHEPTEEKSKEPSAPRVLIDPPFFMNPKPVEEKPNEPKQQFTSPRRTFRMLIFAQRQTMLMRDKEGKFHVGNFVKISPPLVWAQQQQENLAPSVESVVHQQRPFMSLEIRRSHYYNQDPHAPHRRVARDVDHASVDSHSMQHAMLHSQHQFQLKDYPEQHQGFWSSCKQSFKQVHRRRLVAMICLTLLSLSFCCCLFYGSHTRQTVLLLPYLGAQTACFAIYILWMVNKLLHLSELRLSIASDTHSIFRRQLLAFSQTELVVVFTLAMLFHFLLQLTVLAVVWTFYFRLRAERRPKSLNLSYSHRHRRSVSDTAALLYDKVIVEEDEDCDMMEEKKGEPGNMVKVIVPPPPYVKEEKMEDKKDSSVFIV